MRRAFAKSLFPAGVVAFVALISASGAFAEDVSFGSGRTGVSRIVAASVDTAEPAAKNLNTVPVDELSSSADAGSDNSLVRRLMAARPNEDLVICVAGCFGDRDRVVYAQPVDKTAAPRQSISMSALSKQSMNGPSDGASSSIAQSLRASQ